LHRPELKHAIQPLSHRAVSADAAANFSQRYCSGRAFFSPEQVLHVLFPLPISWEEKETCRVVFSWWQTKAGIGLTKARHGWSEEVVGEYIQ
jgi:hypothetical protein